ncbi:MAG: hypothetical protein DRQ97_08730 [Gammaproteobacteria bacterium]|nr:MAG: hypothetical protein DRQ97_08730 [Gammaproteobacteria bacterium]
MRLIGLVLSLGAIMWVLYQSAGGGDAETIVPQEHIKSMEKAENVEQSLQDAAQLQMKQIDELSQ